MRGGGGSMQRAARTVKRRPSPSSQWQGRCYLETEEFSMDPPQIQPAALMGVLRIFFFHRDVNGRPTELRILVADLRLGLRGRAGRGNLLGQRPQPAGRWKRKAGGAMHTPRAGRDSSSRVAAMAHSQATRCVPKHHSADSTSGASARARGPARPIAPASTSGVMSRE